MSSQDLRQKRLLEPYDHLTPADREDIASVATKIDTLRRVEEAVATGHVQTPTFLPEFYEDKPYIEALQWLTFYAIRGYVSEHRRPAPLQDIYNRVAEKIRVAQSENKWPKTWRFPGRSTIDRRANEVASANSKENRIMRKGLPRALGLGGGLYIPNPALYEDVARILEERPT